MHLSRTALTALTIGASLALIAASPRLNAQTDVQKLDDASCQRIYSELEGWYASIPAKLRVTNAEAEALAVRTTKAFVKARRFTEACTGDPVRVGVAHFYAAKASYLLSTRHRANVYNSLKTTVRGNQLRAEINRQMADYFTQVQSHARAALAGLPKEHALQPEALKLLGQSLQDGGKLAEAVTTYGKFIAEYPKSKKVDQMVNALGRALLESERYDEGIALLSQALRERYRSNDYPYYVETLRKLHIGKGDLEGFLATVRKGLKVFPLKTTNSKLGSDLRQVYERLAIYFGFWEGHALMALGLFDEARTAFEGHIAQVNALEKKLTARGQQLKAEYSIYRGRSQLGLKFVAELAGKPAPRDLDALWVTDKRVSLGDSLGKVVAVLFRAVGNARSQEFMNEISRYCETRPEVEMVALHYLQRRQDPGTLEVPLLEELAELGYQGAAGFDPDTENQGLFRAFGVRVGTPTFVILDRTGKPVWMTEDPRPIDIGLARAILKRVADES